MDFQFIQIIIIIIFNKQVQFSALFACFFLELFLIFFFFIFSLQKVFFLFKNCFGATVEIVKAPDISITVICFVFVEIFAFFVCTFFVYFLCSVLCFLIFFVANIEFGSNLFDNKYSLFSCNIVFLVYLYVVKESHLVIVWFYLFFSSFFSVFPAYTYTVCSFIFIYLFFFFFFCKRSLYVNEIACRYVWRTYFFWLKILSVHL